jgi:hypothetical protein
MMKRFGMSRKQLRNSLTQAFVIVLLISNAHARNVQAAPSPAPEVTLSVNEEFFNAFLDSMFTNLKAPAAPLVITPADKDRSAAESYGCPSVITLQREEGGVRTAAKLQQGRISAPLAFAGSYNSTLLGCIEFRGWANTSWVLEFDRTRQTLLARVQVEDIHLTNVPALASGSLVKIVQSAIDKSINPLELLKLDQLSARVPVPPANGTLRLRAKAVKPEIVPGAVQLHIVYEFVADR